MRRTEQLQGLRLMKFEDIYGRTYRGELSQCEAAEVLGMSERTFRRYRDRFEADGAEGLYDRRLDRVSARRAGVDEVMSVLDLFDTRYFDFTAKHFWEKLSAERNAPGSWWASSDERSCQPRRFCNNRTLLEATYGENISRNRAVVPQNWFAMGRVDAGQLQREYRARARPAHKG